MKRREFVVRSAVGSVALGAGHIPFSTAKAELPESPSPARASSATRKILIAGGGFGTAFIRYMAQLTGKPRPRLCYLPTASADSPTGILSWYQNCAPLNVEPLVQASFIASTRRTEASICAIEIVPAATASLMPATAAASSGECSTTSLPAAIARAAASPAGIRRDTASIVIESV